MFHKENSSISSAGGKKGKAMVVRKSDRKKLLQTALEIFLDKNDTAATSAKSVLEDALLKGTLVQRSLKLPTASASLYFRSANDSDDGDDSSWPYRVHSQCVWLQVEETGSRDTLQVPGLALLAVLLSSSIHYPHTLEIPSQASKFVCRGAHVMRAGLLNTPAANAAVVAVAVRGNPQPFAAGILHPDLRRDSSVGLIGPGTKGTGVTVIHCYGDDLWRQQQGGGDVAVADDRAMVSQAGGAPYDNGHYGNVGFVEGKYVLPIVRQEEQENEEELADSVADGDATTAAEASTADGGFGDNATPSNDTDAGVKKVKDEKDAAAAAAAEKEEDEKGQLSPEEVLHAAVCRALVSLNVKKDLPMKMATFYAQHVLPNRPADTTIQLKRTRYKKFGAYVAEKKEEGLLMVGPDATQKDPMAMLTGYERRHDDLRPYLEEKRKNAASVVSPDSTDKKLVLVDLYCIPNHFVSLLRLDRDAVKAVSATSEERKGTGMLTLKEVRAVLEGYIVREELASFDTVQLDGPLTDVLFKKKKKGSKGNGNNSTDAIPTSLSRKDLMAQWQGCQEPAYALVQVPGNKIVKVARGKPPVVTIEVTRRQSNKYVTVVRGLEAFGVDTTGFSKDVAHRFASAASVASTGASSRTTEAQFQGNLADELEALLVGDENLTSHGGAKGSTYHLPKNAIEVVLRKGVSARKKRGGKKK